MANEEIGAESAASRDVDAELRAHAVRLWETEAILEKVEQTPEMIRARQLVRELHGFWAKSLKDLGLTAPVPQDGDVVPFDGGK